MTTEINTWLTNTYHGAEQDLLVDPEFINLQKLYSHLKEHGHCHIKVRGGDYDGSVAKFTVDPSSFSIRGLYWNTGRWGSNKTAYNMNHWFDGRLSWKGKRNNPKFTLLPSNISAVLLNYTGDETLVRFDAKAAKESLLNTCRVVDIDGKQLSVGDKVLYMNLRYGCGGKLCHGVVKEFKAHARGEYVSVIIANETADDESECSYPHSQIWRKYD